MELLRVSSDAFQDGGRIPVRYTGRGEDVSPTFVLEGISANAQSVAITMDDASHPIIPNYNHWVIWNIPVVSRIRDAIPYGEYIDDPKGAVQGVGYGKHRYRGPKPPFKWDHKYVFTVYTLDTIIDLSSNGKKHDLLMKMEGHILQKATISGRFQSP